MAFHSIINQERSPFMKAQIHVHYRALKSMFALRAIDVAGNFLSYAFLPSSEQAF